MLWMICSPNSFQSYNKICRFNFYPHSAFVPKLIESKMQWITSRNQVEHKQLEQVVTHESSAHHCLGLCLGDGRGVGRRQRSSSPAVCAWRRRLAWGRCSGAGVDTHAAPSQSQPAHRLHPSWSACNPDRCAADRKDTCVNQKVMLLQQQMKKGKTL